MILDYVPTGCQWSYWCVVTSKPLHKIDHTQVREFGFDITLLSEFKSLRLPNQKVIKNAIYVPTVTV